MINIIINDQTYPIPTRWEELTLKEAQHLIQFLKTYSPRRKIDRELDEKSIAFLVNICHIPQDIAQKTYPNERIELALHIIQTLEQPIPHSTCDLNTKNNFPQNHRSANSKSGIIEDINHSTCSSFLKRFFRKQNRHSIWVEQLKTWKQNWLGKQLGLKTQKIRRSIWAQTVNHLQKSHWHPPITGIDIHGDPLPMYKITAEIFCEASDLYRTDAWKYAPWMMALLDSSHHYRSEKRLRQKAKQLQSISAPSVIELFNILQQTHSTLKKLFPCCYASPLNKLSSQNKLQSRYTPISHPISWNDMLHFAAGYTPSELEIVRQMPLYSFMQLLNAKCKLA